MNENCVVCTRSHYDVVLKAHLFGWSSKAVTRSGTPHWSTWQMDRETIEQAVLQIRRQSDTERNDHLRNKSKRGSDDTFISNVWPARANMNMQTRRSAHARSRTFARFALGLCSVLITPFPFSLPIKTSDVREGSLVSRRVIADSPIPVWLRDDNHFAINKVNGANESERRRRVMTKVTLKRKMCGNEPKNHSGQPLMRVAASKVH